eukprot:m.63458 g.63458  ORF g.63458 m.63458 type:complete len:54 (+) comp11582_c0_seq1:609-770(+)
MRYTVLHNPLKCVSNITLTTTVPMSGPSSPTKHVKTGDSDMFKVQQRVQSGNF